MGRTNPKHIHEYNISNQQHGTESTSEEHNAFPKHPRLHKIYAYMYILLFLAQYDKFFLSYFQTSILADLSLNSTQYVLLSGYATGIVYAILALPISFLSDYTSARVWVLCITAAWWSIYLIFRSLAHNFGQLLCARLGMGIGQASVEALSISLISELIGWRNVFVG
jgi:MFS family permease